MPKLSEIVKHVFILFNKILKEGSIKVFVFCCENFLSLQFNAFLQFLSYCYFFLSLLQEDIKRHVKEMLQKFGTQKYIANLGHGIYRDMNPDHLEVFVNAVHTFSEEMNATQ